LLNRLLARPKHIGSCDLSCVITRDVSGDLPLTWLYGFRLPDGLACAPYFLRSCAGLITGLTCGNFDFEL